MPAAQVEYHRSPSTSVFFSHRTFVDCIDALYLLLDLLHPWLQAEKQTKPEEEEEEAEVFDEEDIEAIIAEEFAVRHSAD